MKKQNKKELTTIVQLAWKDGEWSWEARPNGYSIHHAVKDCRQFIEHCWGDSKPDGEPYKVLIDKNSEQYKRLKKGKNGAYLSKEEGLYLLANQNNLLAIQKNSQNELELKAKEFATHKHEGQFRKDGKTPYIKHPEAVVEIVRPIISEPDGNPRFLGTTVQETLAAGWLHDVVEDTGTSLKEIRKNFGCEVAGYVSFLTRSKGEDRDAYLQRITYSAPFGVQLIKLADVLHNLSTIRNIRDPAKKEKALNNKINECRKYFLPLAKRICLERSIYYDRPAESLYERLRKQYDVVIKEYDRILNQPK